MKKKLVIVGIMVLMAVTNFACKKLNDLPTSTDNSYDVVNKIFHVIVSANSVPITANILQIRPGFETNPFNTMTAEQYSKYNYGFTPAIGDTIKVNLNAGGPMSVYITYKGVPLDGVNVISTATGSKTTFVYVVKN